MLASCAIQAVSLLLYTAAGEERPPNVVIIFADDLGYGDVGVFGARGFETPNIDRLASQGIRFTDFSVSQPVCSASRASLLTGSYSNRIGIHGALGPKVTHGLHRDEVTIAEILKHLGYATAIFGKWHLGHLPEFLPLRHGFDEYFGLPYSNDMWPQHPTSAAEYPPLPLIEGDRIVEFMPDQTKFTTLYTERAVKFLEKQKDRPFFLYLPHSMPHVPIFASEKFRGRTERGLFGDVIEEIDDSVGRILETLKRLGLDERTLVIFTSDNGPWLSYGDHAGSSGPFREGKGTTFEGGVRVPFVMRWPGLIPPGMVRHNPQMTIDLFPTILQYAGALSQTHPIDGRSLYLGIAPGNQLLRTPPLEFLRFYWGRELQAVRSGRWKLHLPHDYRSLEGPGGKDGIPSKYVTRRIELSLFDLEADPGETTNVADRNPELVEMLKAEAERAREDLGDSATKRIGKGVRPAGSL